jgi:hypothetical protein
MGIFKYEAVMSKPLVDSWEGSALLASVTTDYDRLRM